MSKGDGYIGTSACLVANDQRGNLKLRYGIHTNVAASDTVASVDLSVVLGGLAVPQSDPAATASVALCSLDVGDQAGTPAAGSFLLKSWEADGTAATSFGETINYIVWGY